MHQLEAYPQMLLACLAALSTSSVQVFTLLLKLFCEVCLILGRQSPSRTFQPLIQWIHCTVYSFIHYTLSDP